MKIQVFKKKLTLWRTITTLTLCIEYLPILFFLFQRKITYHLSLKAESLKGRGA